MSAITVRLLDSLHGQAKELAKADGASVNNFIASAVAEKIAARRTVAWLRQQAQEGAPERLLHILAEAPDVPPMPGDEIIPAAKRPSARRKGR